MDLLLLPERIELGPATVRPYLLHHAALDAYDLHELGLNVSALFRTFRQLGICIRWKQAIRVTQGLTRVDSHAV